MWARRLGLSVVLVLVLAGCGGSGDSRTAEEKRIDEALSSLEEELAKNPPGPGFGEASPPPADAAAWSCSAASP